MTQADPTQPAHEPVPRPEGRSSAKRRVALVGTGYIAQWHARALCSVRDVELVAVCDRILPRAQEFARNFGVPQAHGSLEALLAAQELDAVHILLPPDQHFEAARKALEAGVHVFLEKPMCDRLVNCQALVRMAAERGLRLGVGHNFLFAAPYERLRQDLRAGSLGHIDDLTITWHRPLPQIASGPFDTWLLRDPRNILTEIGSHSVAHMLDLVGEPDEMRVIPGNPIELPSGRRFYRRWQVLAGKGRTAVELRFSFVPGFSEYTIHVRGSLAAATVDFERNTYTLHRHHPADPEFDCHAMVMTETASLRRQARRALAKELLSKLHLGARGNPYGASIARAIDAFYAGPGQPLDERVDGAMGAQVIRWCEQMAALAALPAETIASTPASLAFPAIAPFGEAPRILVLGGSGFIGRELVRQLTDAGHRVRMLARNPASLPRQLRESVADCRAGDLMNRDDVRSAMEGVKCVYHLARANVKIWADYEKFEIGATRQAAECALEAGVKRFIYTGTIDSYYAGRSAGTITEQTPLDPRIAHRNFYARAKAASEEILMQMRRERGFPVVIFRPGIVIGRGGGPFHWGVGMWWYDAICQMWGSGRNKLPLVLAEDVARGLVAALEKPGIEGQSFNLVADPCLSAREYIDEIDRCGGMRVERHATPIVRFYLAAMVKWAAKVVVRHPDRSIPSYRDWESRTQKATFDCTAAKTVLGWQPVSEREELVRRGIEAPLMEMMR
jgi:predicted dehydrogenase/nucleoside-diphosphate-sugar epimerase